MLANLLGRDADKSRQRPNITRFPSDLTSRSGSDTSRAGSGGAPQSTGQGISTTASALVSLYGTDLDTPQPSFRLSDKIQCFRLLVLQDMGMRSRQTLYDSASTSSVVLPAGPLSNTYQKINKSIYHSVNELAAYMFGYYGLLMSETQTITKVHYLPAIPLMPCSVLITRQFSVDSTFISKPVKVDSEDWSPQPMVSTTETMPNYENSSTRISIGIVVPIGKKIANMEEAITDNWADILVELVAIQTIIIERLKRSYSNHVHVRHPTQTHSHPLPGSAPIKAASSSDLMSNPRPNFAPYVLQADHELNTQFHSLVHTLNFLVNTPRLFVALKDSNQVLINWATAVSTWLELKDGRYNESVMPIYEKNAPGGLKFLASLCSILMPLRKQILKDPMVRSRKKTVRITVVTSNPVVSQKLVFILSGLIGYEQYARTVEFGTEIDDSSLDDEETETSQNLTFDDTEVDEPYFASEGVKPISIQRANAASYELSNSPVATSASSLSRGWQIPSRTTTTTMASGATFGMSSTKPTPTMTPQLRKETSYASLQNLSCSYGSKQPGTPSSWRGAFGSFMERWAVGKNGTTSFSPPKSDGFDRTPSPSAELDEYPWKSSPGTPAYKSDTSSSSPYSNVGTPTSKKFAHSYVSHQKFNMLRTTTRLTVSKSDIERSVEDKISFLMSSDPQLDFSDHGDYSVISVDDLAVPDVVVPPDNKLPTLTGYSDVYSPTLSLMSCPASNTLESSVTGAMTEDVSEMGKDSVSDTYVINLRQREVKLVHLRSADLNTVIPPPSPLSSSFGRPQPRFVHETQRNKSRPVITLLFSPHTRHSHRDLLDETAVNNYDGRLNQISSEINRFYATQAKKVHTTDEKDNTSKEEDDCCMSIRTLIEELLAI